MKFKGLTDKERSMISTATASPMDLPVNQNFRAKLAAVQRVPYYLRYDGTNFTQYTDETYTTEEPVVNPDVVEARVLFIITD